MQTLKAYARRRRRVATYGGRTGRYNRLKWPAASGAHYASTTRSLAHLSSLARRSSVAQNLFVLLNENLDFFSFDSQRARANGLRCNQVYDERLVLDHLYQTVCIDGLRATGFEKTNASRCETGSAPERLAMAGQRIKLSSNHKLLCRCRC